MRKLSRQLEMSIHRLTDAGLSHRNVAKRLRISPGTVHRCLERRRQYHRGSRPSPWATQGIPPQSMATYEPTPEEIEQACAEIQAEWSEADRRNRCAYQSDVMTLPEVIRHPSGQHVIRKFVGARK